MPLKFQKMHARGDDFVVVDLRGQSHSITSGVARRLGDRNRGIGFNQLAVLRDCEDADAKLEFWNPNGTMLAACGSATRGAADILMREAKIESVSLRTDRGLLHCERASGGAISVDMGTPMTNWRDIPLAAEMDTISLPIFGNPIACSMGNPHCTLFVDALSAIDIASIGPAIESHPLFPLKTNVHFVKVIDRGHIRLRIWERGGGIPLGSGSCACGAVVGGIRRGLLDDTVEILCDGGIVSVRWDGKVGVRLTGPVEPIMRGEISDQLLSEWL